MRCGCVAPEADAAHVDGAHDLEAAGVALLDEEVPVQLAQLLTRHARTPVQP
jgi:hypothetical protein